MIISENNIIRAAELNRLIHCTKIELQHYREVATQLASDKCTFTISIMLHNLDQHDQNLAKQAIKTIHPAEAFWNAALNSTPLQRPALSPCHMHITDGFTESPALRIISAIIAEKEKLYQQLLLQLRQLMPAAEENPILNSYKQ